MSRFHTIPFLKALLGLLLCVVLLVATTVIPAQSALDPESEPAIKWLTTTDTAVAQKTRGALPIGESVPDSWLPILASDFGWLEGAGSWVKSAAPVAKSWQMSRRQRLCLSPGLSPPVVA